MVQVTGTFLTDVSADSAAFLFAWCSMSACAATACTLSPTVASGISVSSVLTNSSLMQLTVNAANGAPGTYVLQVRWTPSSPYSTTTLRINIGGRLHCVLLMSPVLLFAE